VRSLTTLAASLTVFTMIAGGSASAANMCRTEHMQCATNMPVDGYCECRGHGRTEDGTVFARAERGSRTNSTSAGCGAHPNDPGCR
jgi:hypothetical protein